MGYLSRTIKSIFFWTYARNTWQWDLLCVLILAFIFLTPKTWFQTRELNQRLADQTTPISTVLLSAEVLVDEDNKAEIEQHVRNITGRSSVQVVEVRPRRDQDGKIVGYEVDIR